MTDLQFISFTIFVFAILLGFFVNLMYFKLCRDQLKIDYRRVSLSLLNGAIKEEKNKAFLPQLLHCRKVYIAYLVTLGVAVLFVLFVISRGRA